MGSRDSVLPGTTGRPCRTFFRDEEAGEGGGVDYLPNPIYLWLGLLPGASPLGTSSHAHLEVEHTPVARESSRSLFAQGSGEHQGVGDGVRGCQHL